MTNAAPTPIRDAQAGQFDKTLEDDELEFMLERYYDLRNALAEVTLKYLGSEAEGLKEIDKFPRTFNALYAGIRKRLDEHHDYQALDDATRIRVGEFAWTVFLNSREAEEAPREASRRNGIARGSLVKVTAE